MVQNRTFPSLLVSHIVIFDFAEYLLNNVSPTISIVFCKHAIMDTEAATRIQRSDNFQHKSRQSGKE